jgi:hypothetical protein
MTAPLEAAPLLGCREGVFLKVRGFPVKVRGFPVLKVRGFPVISTG